MQLNFILLLIVSIFIAIFAIQNGETVSIDLFFMKREMSQALVILASVGLGALVTGVLSTFGKVKKIRENKTLSKKLKAIETEKNTATTKLETTTAENAELQKINSDLKSELENTENQLRELKSQIKIIPVEREVAAQVTEEPETDD
ncbi:MAG: LapA family protein [Eubacteriales bacterium]|nr:LapA family protein [Eubacteriales bacterium]